VTLRDFIYVDVDRVRSLLAQLAGGVVEGSVERLTKSRDARAGGSIFGLFELGGGLLRERATEQTKSLQDALFLLFEDAASQSGLFDLSVDSRIPRRGPTGARTPDFSRGSFCG